MTIEDVYLLSPLQNGILYHSLRDDDVTVYFMQFCYRINGEFHPEKIREAFDILFERHEVLRTGFNYDDLKKPVQMVLKERRIEYHYVDLRTSGDLAAREAEVVRRKERDKTRGFDLRKDALMRVTILQVDENAFEIIWSFHHILMDGWCLSILTNELFEAYYALVAGKQPQLPPVTPYKRYMEYLAKQDEGKALAYWKEYLAGMEEPTPIPVLGTPKEGNGFDLKQEMLTLDEATSRKLEAIAQEQGTTINSVIQALWGILLGQYNNTDDVVFGTIVSGRPASIPGIETMIGLFINAIPVRVSMAGEQAFTELVDTVQKQAIAGADHHYCQLADIQSQSALGAKLFDHQVVFQNYPVGEEVEGLAKEKSEEDSQSLSIPEVSAYEHSHYQFNLHIFPGKEFRIRFGYNTYEYDEVYMHRMMDHLDHLIEQVVANPQVALKDLKIVTEAEEEALALYCRPYHKELPEGETLVTAFERIAAEHPDQPAMMWEGGSYTFGELNARANRIAHYLRTEYNIQPNDRVGILINRSEWPMQAILGITKAGGAYVPIDPQYPVERIRLIMEDIDAKLLITDADYMMQAMEYHQGAMVALDLQFDEMPEQTENPERVNGEEDVVYVIYTSGSTGKPNGVLVPHRAVVNMANSLLDLVKPTLEDRVLQFASLSFDGSLWEIGISLFSGAPMVLTPQAKRENAEAFEQYVNDMGVTLTIMPPAFFSTLNFENLKGVRVVCSAGEEARPEDGYEFSLQGDFYNLYGPTEFCVYMSTYHLDRGQRMNRIPVGDQMVANSEIYILSPFRQQVPQGVVGEVYVGGRQLSHGYLNRPEVTAQRFIEHPFKPGKKLYRTGDLGRWSPEGALEYLGRLDDQVKVRGFRVEVGEVAVALNHVDGVEDAYVLAEKEEGLKTWSLLAYYTGKEAGAPERIKELLAQKLPEYMIPSFLIKLPELPLNTNGKVDKKALPRPADIVNGEVADATFTEEEQKLKAIWEEVLGVPVRTPQDNFFTLGGHSLKVVQLSSRVFKQFQVRVDLKDIFEHATLSDQATFITGMLADTYENIRALDEADHYELSHAQTRMWLTQQVNPSPALNMPMGFRWSGDLNRPALEKAFRRVVNRHESLRTQIKLVDGEPRQFILPEGSFDSALRFADLSQEANPEQALQARMEEENNQIFDLAEGPAWSFLLVKMAEKEHVLLLNLHHILADAWSLDVMNREIMGLYRAYLQAMDDPFEPLRIHYKDYAAWEKSQLKGFKLKEHRKFWMDTFRDGVARMELPTDFPRPEKRSQKGQSFSFKLGEALSQKLRDLAQAHELSDYMLTEAVVNLLLFGYTGQTDLVTGMPVSGRDHVDLENQIGFFLNTPPFRLQLSEQDSLAEYLAKVKKSLLKALQHQVYPFDKMAEDIDSNPPAGRLPLFDVMVVLQKSHEENLKTQPSNTSGFEVNTIDTGFQMSRYDLTIIFEPTATDFHITFQYATDLFEESRMELLKAYLVEMVETMTENADQSVKEIAGSVFADQVTGEDSELSFDFG